MTIVRALLLVCTAAGSLAVPAVARAPGVPPHGVFVPGTSLGGVRLEMTKAEVLAAWGGRHGSCRECARTTWYFNLNLFEPQGAGVIFRRGRVEQAFTVWRPVGWRTDDGLELGVQTSELTQARPGLVASECRSYTAYVTPGTSRAASVFYVFRGRLWGFGLMPRGSLPCL